MDSVARATDVLVQAEASLRGLVSEAAAAGDYAGVMQIASWASALSELVKPASGGGSDSAHSGGSPSNFRRGTVKKPLRKLRGAPAKSQSGYPRFFRRGDRLVRVSWSKREKKEYQHKAPYTVLQSLVEAMAKVGTDGRVFSTDDFLPLHDAEGAVIPAYQAYVGLSLLKQLGLIDQHGRQGYSIPQITGFRDAVESAWKKLASH
jgi:hypothetical protein